MSPRELLSQETQGLVSDAHGTDSEAGFTLVEVVVATMLATLVAGLVLTTYILAAGYVTRWQTGLAAENALHVVQERLAADLRRAERVVWAEWLGADARSEAQNRLELVKHDSMRLVYEVHDSVLVRNARPMHGPELRVADFDVTVYGSGEVDGSTRPERQDNFASSGSLAPLSLATSEEHPVYVEVRLGWVREAETSSAVLSAHFRSPHRWAPEYSSSR